MSNATFQKDDLIGEYRIVRKVGEGGMGEVYEAWDARLARPVAIKIVTEASVKDLDLLARFASEGRALARLNHPNIVGLYSQGEHMGRAYMVMEFVEGKTVNEFINQCPFGLDTLLDLFRQMLAGLGAAHELNIIHRDIKPENIIITSDLNVKIVDFGVAKDYSNHLSQQTTADLIMGTVHYFAPELIAGKVANAQTDLFSMGLVFYYMIHGQSPFTGKNNIEVLESIRNADVKVHSRASVLLPEEARILITRLTRKAPDMRYGTAKEAIAELNGVNPDTIPNRLKLNSMARMYLSNASAVRAICSANNLMELEARAVINLAINSQDQKVSATEKTVVLSLVRTIELSDAAVHEGIRQFRAARSAMAPQLAVPQAGSMKSAESGMGWKVLLGAALAGGAFIYFTQVSKPKFSGVAKTSAAVAAPVVPVQENIVSSPAPKIPEFAGYPAPHLANETIYRFISKVVRGTYTGEMTASRWTLLKTENNIETWESDSLGSKEIYASGLFPVISSKSETNQIEGNPVDLFPLKVGSTVSFTVRPMPKLSPKGRALAGQGKLSQPYLMQCSAIKEEPIKLSIGRYDTIRVECIKNGEANLATILNYSPKLQHLVRQETSSDENGLITKTITELDSFSLPIKR